MKTKFLQRVVWLMIPLLTIFTTNVWGQASTHTSNVTLNDGSNCSDCSIVISGYSYSGKKLGTSKATGSTSFTVPAGVTTVYIHAAKWNGESGNLTIARTGGGTVSPTSVTLTADGGVSSSSPFTLSAPAKASTSYFFTLTLSSVNAATTITLTTSARRAVVWGVNTASATKTFTLAVPKGDGTYDETQTEQEKTALTEANAIKKRNCGGGDLDGYYASIWTSTAINTPTSTYPSPVYTSSTADGSLPASGTKLYPVFTNDAGKYLTNPSCAAVKTLSSIAITTAPTTTKYLVGETFSSAGAVVTATYSDATTATVSADWTPTTGLASGSNTITATYTEGGVTKTATTTVTAYAMTVQKKDEDGNTISAAGVTASASGRSLTASVGSTKYVFKTWKFGTASGTSISNATSATTGALTGTPSAAVTVIAEFYKPCTVTWSVNGVTSTTTVARGQTASTPADPTPSGDCAGLVFRGWTASPISGTSDSAPGDLFNTTTPSAITGDVTFYAVFAEED